MTRELPQGGSSPGRRNSGQARASLGLLVLLTLGGCRSAPLLYDVSVAPAVITPDGDGDRDVTTISYAVGRSANIDIHLVGADGQAHALRKDRPRAPGRYQATFGGVVDGRMLPEGDYQVVVEARAADGVRAQLVAALRIEDGDHEPPVLHGFTVQPQRFTPNQDGLDDRVALSYRLDEPADVRIWLETLAGDYVADILAEKSAGDDPGAPGPHVYEYDAGVDADAPPPADGQYVVVAAARDKVGNIDRRQAPLAIGDGGQPRAGLQGDVEWSHSLVPLGGTLRFTVTVANVGRTPIRTRGPEPGTTYDNTMTFNQQAVPAILLLARRDGSASRLVTIEEAAKPIAIDLAEPESGKHKTSGSPFAGRLEGDSSPLSLGLPGANPAGQRIDLCGQVVRKRAPVAGAEVYAFEADGDNGRRTVTDAGGRFCFRGLVIPPPSERTFARSPGAVRLGLEYDEARTDVEYPFRWQLGRTSELGVCEGASRLYLCLMPGQTVTVTGGVRFVEPPYRRSTRVYLALLHEDVRRMHGPYGEQRITIEY